MKNGRELAKNHRYTIFEPLFQFNEENDTVTMIFPVNSSLQCFRTAALSMVTLNTKSRNPMGHVNAENHSKHENPQVSMG